MRTGLAFLQLEAATTFVLDGRGRILRENDPDQSRGPRVATLSCVEGTVTHVRADLDDGVAANIIDLFGAEPPWISPDERPTCLAAVLDLLSPPAEVGVAFSYRFPDTLPTQDTMSVIASGTPAGEALLANLHRTGPPAHLIEAGFVSVADFWPPWCLVLEEGVIAAMAFAARLSAEGAAVGLYTFPAFRGRGHAAAVTAGWTNHPALAGRALFYGTSVSNLSSQRVAERLGLKRVGMVLRVG